MIASELSEGLHGAAMLIGALAFLWVVVVHGGRLKNMKADIHGVKLSVDTGNPDKPLGRVVVEDIKPSLDDVNSSVNHKSPHELPLVKRVGVLEQHVGTTMQLVGDMRDGQIIVLKRLDGLERAARHACVFQRELVKQLGLDIQIPEERTPT